MTEDDRQESDGERDLSDSDSEPELEPAEYEKRRELCLRQIILTEIQFNKLKIVLRDLKIKQVRSTCCFYRLIQKPARLNASFSSSKYSKA